MSFRAVALALSSLFLLSAGDAWAWIEDTPFQQTCQDISVQMRENGPTIVAMCPKVGGRLVKAEYLIKGIANDEGKLVHRGDQLSSFQFSCNDIEFKWNKDKMWIVAACDRSDGDEINARIEVQGLYSWNGTLRPLGEPLR